MQSKIIILKFQYKVPRSLSIFQADETFGADIVTKVDPGKYGVDYLTQGIIVQIST